MTISTLSRRRALKQAGMAGLGLASLPAWSWADSLEWAIATDFEQAPDEELIPFTDIPENFTTKRNSPEPEREPGEHTIGQDLRLLKSWITPNIEFFGVSHYGIARLDAAAWTLTVGGLVGRQATFTLGDLKKRPRVERTVTFECSGNRAQSVHRMVGTARWTGVSLPDLLRELKPDPAAKEVFFWAADKGKEMIRGGEYEQQFARAMSLDDALRSEAIVAFEMNGAPLPQVHGFPARLIVPGWYGVANVKWLTGIELSDRRLMNRFMGRDYVTIMGRRVGDRIEWVETSVTRQRVKSVVARVTRNKSRDRLTVFGAAWTDGTPLRSVDVRIDDGPWQAATLEPSQNPYAWTFWTLAAPALAAGSHTVVSRATDRTGRTQPENLELKKTNWEDNAQFRRTIMVST